MTDEYFMEPDRSLDQLPAAERYRGQVLAIDPGARIKGGPVMLGGRRYDMYSVLDSAGTSIGYTDGNEQGEGWAWARALGTLQRRALKATPPDHPAAGENE